MSSVLCHQWKLEGQHDAYIKILQINRPEKAGAMNAEILDALYQHLIETDAHCRALVLISSGKHFSAGADLNWMKESSKLSKEQNLEDAKKLDLLFSSLVNTPCPTISVVQGACYGGAVGLAAASDIVLCETKSRFCLSEVKIGLLPAVIYPYLERVLEPRVLSDWSLTARVVEAQEAKSGGLVTEVVQKEELDEALIQKLNLLLAACGERQTELKQMQRDLLSTKSIKETTTEYIANARMSESGQEGLTAFFEKKSPSWKMQLGDQLQKDLRELLKS